MQEVVQKLFVRIMFSVVLPAATIVLCLYILNSIADIKYLPASGLAFAVGFYVIYLVFKYFVNPDVNKEAHIQLKRYGIVFIVNLVINVEIIYLLVNYASVPLLTAQTVAAVIIGYESYYAYRSLMNRAQKKLVVRMPTKLEDEIIYYDEDGEQI
jgi:putative flippase GtrA